MIFFRVINNPEHMFFGWEVVENTCRQGIPRSGCFYVRLCNNDGACEEVRSNMPMYNSFDDWKAGRPVPLFIEDVPEKPAKVSWWERLKGAFHPEKPP